MTIGAVLKELKQDFPEISVSKIRFLETEELVFPARSKSGYRKYSPADIDRLRYILTLQRDHYMPLKVIREQLDSMDEAAGAGNGLATVTPLVSAEQFRPAAPVRLSSAELAAEAGVDEDFIVELERVGILRADTLGEYDADSAVVAHTAAQLRDYGIDSRHLRSVLNAANREAGLITRAAAPTARSRKENAVQKAEEMSREMTALMVSLHGVLVKREVNRTTH
ncbi:MerR family transcriptional regulator [Corynebacterium sp. TAE3-ERU12]|nr:MerR family transcriptional regulator [Corynebacterium sp. TAE3-ERU12]MBV7295511.1 MerR family transcriptional regulator [Corynebacterium sp. TAE3-ERU12]